METMQNDLNIFTIVAERRANKLIWSHLFAKSNLLDESVNRDGNEGIVP